MGVFILVTSGGLGGVLRAENSAILPEAERDRLYKATYDAKKRGDDALDYAFVETVPILAEMKTVSAECQCVSSLALHAFGNNSALVYGAVAAESSRQRSDRPELSSVTTRQWQTAISKIFYPSAAGLSKDVHRKRGSGPKDFDPETHSAIHFLVPDIERLATVAGYEYVAHEFTLGNAVCLATSAKTNKGTEQIGFEGFFTRVYLLADLNYRKKPVWSRMRTGLRQGCPFSVMTKNGRHFLVFGYSQSHGTRGVLFGFDPTLVERAVYYLGRQMPESRLEATRAKQPNPFGTAPRYYDILTSHKQYQHRGFCAIDYDSIVSMSFIDNVRIDETAIRSKVSRAFDYALQLDEE